MAPGACFFISAAAGGAEAAAVGALQMLHCFKKNPRLVFHNAKLADPVPLLHYRISRSIHWHTPFVVVAAVTSVDHTHRIRLQKPPGLECTGARHHMRLIPCGQFHGNSQSDQAELARLQFHTLSGAQVDPVGLSVNVAQPFNIF